MSTRAARILAQAKINVRLRVLAREANGYHQLETVFARLDLADEIVVRAGTGGRSLDCRGGDVGAVEQNLAWRAAMALRDAGGPDTFAIEIDKRIPVGGGLGGGSADAGAVLRALNALSSRPRSDDALLAIAATLGADVPFATTAHAFALAWGRGDRMLALPPPPEATVWLAVPPFGVSTAAAYSWLAAARGDAGVSEPSALTLEALAAWPTLAALARNDFEPVVERRHPALAGIRQAFRDAGARIAMLAGSGSTVLAIFDGGDGAAGAADLSRSPFESFGARLLRSRTISTVAPVTLSL